MAAELTDQNKLSTVINYLRDTNATEELLLDEVVSHRDVLASADSKKYFHDAPILLEFIGEVLSDMLLLTKDTVKNTSQLIQDQRDDAEENRLNQNNNKKTDNAVSGVTFGDVTDKLGRGGWLSGLLATGTFLIGTITGVISQLATMIKLAFSETKIGKAVAEVAEFFTRKISTIFDFGKGLVGRVAEFATKTLSKLFSKEKGIFSFVGEIADFIGKGVKFFSGSGGGLIDDFAKVFSKITFFFNIGKSFGKAITRLLGKIALPITIIMSLWDTVIGAIDGYKKEGLAGAFKGGLSGLLNSLVGSLLDLAKDGISWLLGALGFENAEKMLDSFSFSKLISDGISNIVDAVSYFFNYITEEFSFTKFKDAFEKFNVFGVFAMISGGFLDMIKGAVSWILTLFGAVDWASYLDSFSFQDLYMKLLQGIKDTISAVGDWFASMPAKIANFATNMTDLTDQFIKTILQNVLPRKDANSAWYSPMNLAAAAIPASVYEYAGMNPDTGAVIQKTETKISSVPNDTATGISRNVGATAPTIINNVSRGGDVHNVSNSNVNQNVNGAAGPIVTGSAMGLFAY